MIPATPLPKRDAPWWGTRGRGFSLPCAPPSRRMAAPDGDMVELQPWEEALRDIPQLSVASGGWVGGWVGGSSVPHCHELTGNTQTCHRYGALPASLSHLGGGGLFHTIGSTPSLLSAVPILPGSGRLRNTLSALPPFPLHLLNLMEGHGHWRAYLTLSFLAHVRRYGGGLSPTSPLSFAWLPSHLPVPCPSPGSPLFCQSLILRWAALSLLHTLFDHHSFFARLL